MDLTTILNYIWIGIGVFTFLYLIFFKTAPYGRHFSDGWGPTLNNRLGWLLMESPAVVLFLFYFFTFQEYTNAVIIAFIVFWMIHYINRTFIYPLRINTKGKRMPIIIVFSAVFFNSVNTFFIASYLARNPEDYGIDWLHSWQFIMGVVLFLVGFFINQYSDFILINLRGKGEVGYKIPHGFLYKYITNPNYFGEIIEWTGFAIMTWCLPSFSFIVWTLANLVPRAIANHKWYKEKFDNYPKNRKILIPFIY